MRELQIRKCMPQRCYRTADLGDAKADQGNFQQCKGEITQYRYIGARDGRDEDKRCDQPLVVNALNVKNVFHTALAMRSSKKMA